MHDHHIVCGFGYMGFRIAELLRQIGEPFIVVAHTIRPEWIDLLNQQGVPFIIGDGRSEAVLQQAGIATARSIVIVTSDDLINLHIAADAERMHPGIQRIVRVFDHDIAERIEHEMGIRHVYSPAMLTTPVFIAAAQGEEMLLSFPIDAAAIEIIRIQLPDISTDTREPVHPKQSVSEFCTLHDLIPLTYHATRSRPGDTPGIGSEPQGILVAACTHDCTERLRSNGLLMRHSSYNGRKSQHNTGTPIPLLNKRLSLPSLSDMLKAWRGLPPFLRTAFLGLSIMLASSAVVFHQALKMPWIDSLYFVVSILTTVGFGDYNLHDAPAWVKLYGCFVMLAGASLVAIVYGIITDFIVSARVDTDQRTKRRSAQYSDHVVIVGLGDVGTRVAEVLRMLQRPVIAIERDVDHEAAPSVADNLHVVVGDANRRKVLDLANIGEAQSIIVTTEDDLANLRIAHQAERANPRLRKVVRIYDSMLASRLVSNLGIDRAVNSAATAAAMFVAATVHPEIVYGFTVEERLFTLRWLQPAEIAERKLLFRRIKDAQLHEVAILMARRITSEKATGRMASPSYDVTIRPDHALLILEEYDPKTRSLIAPILQFH